MKVQNVHNWRGILTVIGCVCFHTALGNEYIWGCVNVYISSYLYFEGNQHNATTKLLLIFIPIRGFLLGFLFPLGPFLKNKFGITVILLIDSICFLSCFISFIFVKNIYAYIVILSIGFSVPMGLGYITTLDTAWRHFPEKRGLISGIILCAYGSGSFFLNLIAQYIVNPNNLKAKYLPGKVNDEKYFSKEVYKNVPYMWTILVIIWGSLLLIGILLIRNPKRKNTQEWALIQEKEEIPEDEIEVEKRFSLGDVNMMLPINVEVYPIENERGKIVREREEENIDPYSLPDIKTGLKSIQFWVLYTMLTFALIINYTFSFCYKPIGQHFGYSDYFLTVVGTIYVLFMGTTRIPFGYLFQRVKFKILITIIICGMVFCTSFLSIIGRNSEAGYLIIVDLCVIFIGGNFPIYTAMCPRIFGIKYGSQMYGFMAGWCYILAGLLTFFGNYHLPKSIGYNMYLLIPAGFNLVGLIMMWTLLPIKPKWIKTESS